MAEGNQDGICLFAVFMVTYIPTYLGTQEGLAWLGLSSLGAPTSDKATPVRMLPRTVYFIAGEIYKARVGKESCDV